MSIFTDIKHWYGLWSLKRSNIEGQRQHQVFNLDQAKCIMILFDATEPKDIEQVKKYVSKLSPGKEKVSVFGYVNEVDKSFEHMSSLHFDFFSNKDLNWYGKPEGMVINNFLQEEYDILIDLTLSSFYPLTYLAVASPSKFKVGRFRDDVQVFDLTIEHTDSMNLSGLISQMNHYLTLIKPPHAT